MVATVESATTSKLARYDLWASIARSYAAFSSPLVPCREDISTYERMVRDYAEAEKCGGLDVVMLGVTPGITAMSWPEGSRVLGVDASPDVIHALWPGDILGVRKALCASWFEIPKQRKSCDVIVGDGSLNACRFPGELRRLGRSLGDLLKSGGVLAVRCYVQPRHVETVDSVFDALFGARGLNVDSFKLRLFLAMQRSSRDGVAVMEAAHVLDSRQLCRSVMKDRFGWSDAATEPFSKWRTSGAIYTFPTLQELREAMGECFDEVSVTYPGYELGQCCPTLVMRSRAR